MIKFEIKQGSFKNKIKLTFLNLKMLNICCLDFNEINQEPSCNKFNIGKRKEAEKFTDEIMQVKDRLLKCYLMCSKRILQQK